mmetsp:Transcript_18996/g.48318  ORF Transcript_18996/g.48318 Transcript_18996/m.48318 type:complete len:247 (+) Transcript_18996:849-1589(+)
MNDILDEHLLDNVKDKLHTFRIQSIRDVRVYTPVWLYSIQIKFLNVLDDVVKIAAALVVWAVVLQGAEGKLLAQKIHLVEEDDEGHWGQDLYRQDVLEQAKRLSQAVGAQIFRQEHAVVVKCYAVQHGVYVAEAVYPLAALIALTAHIHHAYEEFFDLQMIFNDAQATESNTQTVVVAGEIVGLADLANTIEQYGAGVRGHNLLVSQGKHALDGRILPELVYDLSFLWTCQFICLLCDEVSQAFIL